MLIIAPFSSVFFLGYSLTFMMVYVWGRRNETFPMNFLGLFNFPAPWLPWVLLAFSVLLGASPVVDLVGIFVGHVYYYLQDIVPKMRGRWRGKKLIVTPSIIRYMFEEPAPEGADIRMQFNPEAAGVQGVAGRAPAQDPGGLQDQHEHQD